MKVTRTALVVSICFNIVFLPYVVVKLIAAITEDNIMAPSAVTSILLPILSRTHFINNIVNFMIYISMDMAFRRHCKAIFTEIVYKVLNALKYINCTLCEWIQVGFGQHSYPYISKATENVENNFY
jgi:hypothetical protein